MNEISIVGLPLETLAEMANQAAELAQEGMVRTISRAADCGRYLLAAKAQVRHGEWAAWLGANFDRDQRTAARYMRLAEAYQTRLSDLQQARSITHALQILANEQLPELPEPSEPVPTAEPAERDEQERPTIRQVSTEARKVPESEKPKTTEKPPEVIQRQAWTIGDQVMRSGIRWQVRSVGDDTVTLERVT